MDANTSPRHDGSGPGQAVPSAAEILSAIRTQGLVPWLVSQGETPAFLWDFVAALRAAGAGES
jgi:hypothetical protein